MGKGGDALRKAVMLSNKLNFISHISQWFALSFWIKAGSNVWLEKYYAAWKQELRERSLQHQRLGAESSIW